MPATANLIRLSQGTKTLLLIARFKDATAAQQAIRHDVSAGIEKGWIDGLHNKYEGSVLVHVALTGRPVIPGLGEWKLIKQDATGVYYSKELLPADDFYQKTVDRTVSFSDTTLDELVENHDLMLQNKVAVPLQIEHEDGAQLGDVIGLEIAERSSPLKLSGGKQTKHKASKMLKLSQGSIAMNLLDELGAELGLEFTPEMDDAAKTNMIKDAIVSLKNKDKPADGADAGSGQPPQVPMSQAQPVTQPATQQNGVSSTVAQLAGGQQPTQVSVRFSVTDWPRSAVDGVKNGRIAQLEQLVSEGTITPAQKDEVVREFCTDTQIRVCLSQEANGQKADKAFENMIKVLSVGSKQWKETGRTGTTEGEAAVHMSRNERKSPLQSNREHREAQRKNYQPQI